MISKENLQKIKEYVDKIHDLNNSIIEKVVSAVCMIVDVDIEIFYTKSLQHNVCYARRMVWYILRRNYNIITHHIADTFSYTSANIRQGIAIMELHIKQYKNVAIDYNQVMAVLR